MPHPIPPTATLLPQVVPSKVTDLSAGTAHWPTELAAAIRDPDVLCDALELSTAVREAARRAASLFPVVVPRSFLARMRIGDPGDPLLRQVLPLDAEADGVTGFSNDPVGDTAAEIAPGLLHKYQGRVLLIAAGACAVHCRYCFRRHYPYDAAPRRREDWRPALDQIQADSSIHEVILSGGDPLVLSDSRLSDLVEHIDAIPHVNRLRIHTRLPVVLPARVSDRLIHILTAARTTPVVVIHANHPNEIVRDCADALRRLVRSGITTLNQSVLLAGVNDSVDTLALLSERLVDLGVIPYYLHQLDRVAGAAHFEVPERVGLALVAQLAGRLPGYAIPKYVREVPEASSKIPIEIEDI